MILQNGICHIEINTDQIYTVDSADNRHYDVTLNPRNYQRNDYTNTLSIHVDLCSREYQIEISRLCSKILQIFILESSIFH